jgi:hypothetical protein
MAPKRERITPMNDHSEPLDQNEDDILSFDVSDEALEAAARTIPGAAMSFPNAPTVNILVVCCSE